MNKNNRWLESFGKKGWISIQLFASKYKTLKMFFEELFQLASGGAQY